MNASASKDGASPRQRHRGRGPKREKPAPRKLSFKETRELETLPSDIAAAEAALSKVEALLADPTAYARDPAAFQTAFAEVDGLRRRKEELEERWLELELKRESFI
jgi:ATP-binding cassette subfamily F protein uup